MTEACSTDEHYEGRVDYPPLGSGDVLAPGYEVIEHLHQSHNFDVYDAFSEERSSRCIAKVPRQDLLDDGGVRRGLLREGRLLEKLTHPHIVRLYEVIEEPRPLLILETLTGQTLAHIVDTSYRRLPIRDVAHLGLHLCSAVHYLHRNGILHLDLKPSNIVSERQVAKILDLSIARPPGRVREGAGTKQYMAPEQVRGGQVSPATDVWGIGAVLFEAATAEPPFNAGDEESSDGETDTDLDAYEQVLRRAEPVRAYRRVPPAFTEAIRRCLEPDPAARPTVEELAESLRAVT